MKTAKQDAERPVSRPMRQRRAAKKAVEPTATETATATAAGFSELVGPSKPASATKPKAITSAPNPVAVQPLRAADTPPPSAEALALLRGHIEREMKIDERAAAFQTLTDTLFNGRVATAGGTHDAAQMAYWRGEPETDGTPPHVKTSLRPTPVFPVEELAEPDARLTGPSSPCRHPRLKPKSR